MDQYHVYEKIGTGKYSAVYKGRKKKTIEYFALKSVDKSHKSKILQEVRILHALDHLNVLKFYAWYETSAHLWLVLEYCVGGDLLSLLRQDVQLPEESIHDLACDIVKALLFLHSKGIIYCDLKPSNILLDENGHTKLCDFGLARKLSDLTKAPSSAVSQSKRGTPFYMAPELFQDGGVHSFASDLWALGCVLYECYTGKPPFMGREFTQLAKSIISDPTPPLSGNPSRSFVNLVNSLLVKDPAERIQWSEVCGHAFWKTKFTPAPLPPQLAFDDMIGIPPSSCLSERNGDRNPHAKTPPRSREKEIKGRAKQDENINSGARNFVTPVKGAASGRKTQSNVSARVVDDKQANPPSTRGVNLLRLSRIAKLNLLKENEKENYRRPSAKTVQNDAEINIENTDMELDFNENNEDETQDDPDPSDNISSTPEENQGIIEEESECHPSTPNTGKEVRTIVEPCSENFVSATPPTASPQPKNPRGKAALGTAIESETPKSSNGPSDVFWHPSDLSVRPVMPSRKADKAYEPIASLPFETLHASEFEKMPREQLDAFNTIIVTIFNGNGNIREKQNVIWYLETLSNNAEVASIITNGPIMPVLIKMLRQSKASALRIQLVMLIGLLIRHSTYINEDLANFGILSSLTDSLRDRQEKVRRYSMAALGELLFYISTQSKQPIDNIAPEAQPKDNRSTTGWQVSNALVSLIVSLLRKGEDDVTQLYALRTIENICSLGPQWVARFSSQDVINNLCYIFRAVGKQESIRLTAGSCLVRLVRFNPSSIQSVIEKLSFKDTAAALVKGSPREQQIILNLFNLAILGSHMFTSIGRFMPLDDKNLVPSLVTLIEQGSEVLRGKALVFVALLCKNGRRWLPHFFCNAKFLSTVDRLAKEKNSYLQQCIDAFVNIVAFIVPGLLETITNDIHQIMGGRRHGHVAALTSRTTPKTNMYLFPVVLHLLGCTSFKHRVVSYQVLQHLANLVKLVESPFQGRDDFQITLLRVLESIVEEQSLVLEWPNVFIRDVLPRLCLIYKGNKDGNARFLCLKILFDVMVILLDEPQSDEQQIEELKSISKVHFLPLYPMFVEDEDPIPICAQKLLLMLVEFDYIKVLDILQIKAVQQCFKFLLGDVASANVNNVKLCLALASAPELETKTLSQLKVVRKIGNLLEFVNANEMNDFVEPTLSLCRAFLLRSVYNRIGAYSKEPSLLSNDLGEAKTVMDQQQCIRDIADFGGILGVLLELSMSHETNIADMASECVVLLLKVAPREGTTGFLTNLRKVSAILERWDRENTELVVQRMLHALGYSCRQYFSHAMILSMTISEVPKIKLIMSEIQRSNVADLGSVASLVVSELDRLPRNH